MYVGSMPTPFIFTGNEFAFPANRLISKYSTGKQGKNIDSKHSYRVIPNRLYQVSGPKWSVNFIWKTQLARGEVIPMR